MGENISKLCLENLKEKFQKNRQKPIEFNFKDVIFSHFGKENIDRNHRYLHYIHYYPRRIFPYIPLYILSIYELKNYQGFVLDPFAGSGTILLESTLNPVIKRNSLGVELNPLGRLISNVKTASYDFNRLKELKKEISKIYQNNDCNKIDLPNYNNIDLWFSTNSIKKLSRLISALEIVNGEMHEKDFFWLCFSNIIRTVSKADTYIPPPVILKLSKYKESKSKYEKLKKLTKQADNPKLWKLFENSVDKYYGRLLQLSEIRKNEDTLYEVKIIGDDARDIRFGSRGECGRIEKKNSIIMEPNSVDIILTSPLYITAQKYIRTSKLELIWLGYSNEEIIKLDKKSIGTERLVENIAKLGIKSLDSLIRKTEKKNVKRAKRVFSYFFNMVKAIKEMYRVLIDEGYLILIIGNNRILGREVLTYDYIKEISSEIGFKTITILEDSIKYYCMITKRNGTSGLIKKEFVLIMRKES